MTTNSMNTEVITKIISWSLVGFNLTTSVCLIVIGYRRIKKAKEVLQDSERIYDSMKKQANEMNEIWEKEMNYCAICKTIIKLRK